MSKHIALYIGSLERGGAERVLCNLAEYFYGQGYRVTFVTTYLYPDEYEVKDAAWKMTGQPDSLGQGGSITPPSDQKEGIRRILSGLSKEETTRSRLWNVYLRYRKLRSIWKELQPDVILSFLGKNNVMALQTAQGLKKNGRQIPVYVSVRSNPAREYADKNLDRQMRRLFPRAAGVILQTTDAVNYFPEQIRKNASVMPNSLNPDFIRPLFAGERRHNIVSVGRLDENKDQALLIRAFGKFAPEHPDWTLTLCGDGPAREKFETLARETGVSDRITFAGRISQVADYIEKDAIYVLTSRQEGMPNSLIEAMALGLACISTDCPCGGPRDLIRPDHNGILIPVGDEEALTRALAELADNPEKCRTLGTNASQVQQTLSPEVINKRWENLLFRA